MSELYVHINIYIQKRSLDEIHGLLSSLNFLQNLLFMYTGATEWFLVWGRQIGFLVAFMQRGWQVFQNYNAPQAKQPQGNFTKYLYAFIIFFIVRNFRNPIVHHFVHHAFRLRTIQVEFAFLFNLFTCFVFFSKSFDAFNPRKKF